MLPSPRFVSLFTLILLAAGQLQAQYAETGWAAFYSDKLHGRRTASGEVYDRTLLTCAHKTHAFGTLLRVTRLDNNRSVVVRVNDRGPFHEGYVTDLSLAGAMAIGLDRDGKAMVQVEPVGFSDKSLPGGTAGGYNAVASGGVPKEYNAAPGSVAPSGMSAKTGATGYGVQNAPTETKELGPVPPMPARNLPVPGEQRAIPQEFSMDSRSAAAGQLTSLPQGSSGYGVQVGSYGSLDNARRQAEALQGLGISQLYYIEVASELGSKLFRLVSGRFESRAQAEAHLVQLRNQYLVNGYVTKL